MNIETLTLKVEKAQETVTKKEKTIERHEKQLQKKLDFLSSKGINVDVDDVDASRFIDGERHEWTWDVAEVNMKLNDIKGAKKKLAEAEKILGNWKEKLANEQNKANYLENNCPQIIKDFLEEWKSGAIEFYLEHYEKFQVYKKKIDAKAKKAKEELIVEHDRRTTDKLLKEKGLDWSNVQANKDHFAGTIVRRMDSIYDEKERLEWLLKTLEEDRKGKMFDFINRITKVTGVITDASNLYISRSGNINGYVIGEDGKADVETIIAGGYNIQVAHYRTLVKPRK